MVSRGNDSDTTKPTERMVMQIIGSPAEFERTMLRERTKEASIGSRLALPANLLGGPRDGSGKRIEAATALRSLNRASHIS